MKTGFTILLLILSFCSCNERASFTQTNRIKKLSFATGGCYGQCPFLAIEIDSSLDYKFYGGRHAEKQGYYKGRISQAFWDSINVRFASLQRESLDTPVRTVDDMPIQVMIYFDSSIKRIQKQEMELPQKVRDDLYWLMDSYKRVELKKATDTIRFETTIQYSPGLVPPPPIKEN